MKNKSLTLHASIMWHIHVSFSPNPWIMLSQIINFNDLFGQSKMSTTKLTPKHNFGRIDYLPLFRLHFNQQ